MLSMAWTRCSRLISVIAEVQSLPKKELPLFYLGNPCEVFGGGLT